MKGDVGPIWRTASSRSGRDVRGAGTQLVEYAFGRRLTSLNPCQPRRDTRWFERLGQRDALREWDVLCS